MQGEEEKETRQRVMEKKKRGTRKKGREQRKDEKRTVLKEKFHSLVH